MKSIMKRVFALCALLVTPVLFAGEAALKIPDVQVVDQNGKALRFRSDLVEGKVVAISFVFTSCTTICTPLGTRMASLQPLLQGRDDVRLISVSIDPTTDTPQRLKEWSAKFTKRPGWTLVTGDAREIEKLLVALRADTGDPSAHSPLMLIGNHATGRWTRVNGLQPADRIVAAIDGIRATKEARK